MLSLWATGLGGILADDMVHNINNNMDNHEEDRGPMLSCAVLCCAVLRWAVLRWAVGVCWLCDDVWPGYCDDTFFMFLTSMWLIRCLRTHYWCMYVYLLLDLTCICLFGAVHRDWEKPSKRSPP